MNTETQNDREGVCADVLKKVSDYMYNERITRAHLSRLLGISRSRVSVILGDPERLSLKDLFRVCAAVGLRVSIDVEKDTSTENRPLNTVVNWCIRY